MDKRISQISKALGFESKFEALLWLGVALIWVPLTTYYRLWFLDNPLLQEPHGRQIQTAITTFYFAKDAIAFLDYKSPLDGALWNLVYEFPLYQWCVAQLIKFGLSMEVASRGFSLFLFIVGLGYFFGILRRFSSRRIASWATLFYLIMPTSVLYSRSGMIDVMGTTLFLASIYYALLFWQNPQKHIYLVLTTVFGMLCGLVKSIIWYIPFSILGFYLLHRWIKGGLKNKTCLLLMIGLLMELAVVVCWLLHTSSNVQQESIYSWQFGTIEDRFSLVRWVDFLSSVRVMILNDWLILPFLFGLFALVRKRPAYWIFVVAMSLPFLIHFRVFTSNHGYYFIPITPYFAWFTALGVVYLCDARRELKYGILSLCVLLFAYRTYKSEYSYTEMKKDFEPMLKLPRAIKAATSPEEITLVDSTLIADGLHLPLYSERYVGLIRKPSDVLIPSVFLIQDKKNLAAWLGEYSPVWLQANEPEIPLYRVRESAIHPFDTDKFIGAINDTKGRSIAGSIGHTTKRIQTCGLSSAPLLKVDSHCEAIEIQVGTTSTVYMPCRNYLSLPRTNAMGCDFRVTVWDSKF